MQAELDESMSFIKTMTEQEGLELVYKSELGGIVQGNMRCR